MTRQWRRWAGTIQDIERATRVAIDVLAQRSRNEPPCQIEIALPQRVTNADSPDALQTEIDTRDLALIRSIRIDVGSKRGLRATIHVERDSPSLTVEVVGEDRTRVEGLTSQLEELLRRGAQRPRSDETLLGVGIGVCFATLFIGIFVWRTFDPTERIVIDTPIEYLYLILILFGSVGSLLAVLWLMPGLQLLKPGEPTRLRRFRLTVMAFVGSLIASIVATVIYEVVQ
jgi:hypothetical protein